MPAELEAVNRLLDDERFLAPYRAHFHASLGRPPIPIETYLRMMFLQRRYKLSFETLCREVNDSLSRRRFCRIGLGERVPDSSTLMKITKRCGPETAAAAEYVRNPTVVGSGKGKQRRSGSPTPWLP